MNKRKKWILIALVCAAVVIIAGMVVWQMEKKNNGIVNRVMYVPYGEDSYIMVDQSSESIFTITFPEAIYDRSGKKITKDQLKKGNILDISGNGIMAESYPGQYPGITKIVVVEEGKESDADKYQHIIDSIYSEPDPAQIPWMDVAYKTKLAAVTTAVLNGSYNWNYEDENGQTQSVVGDSAHVLMWSGEDLREVTPGETADLTLQFSKKPVEVTVSKWDAEYLGQQEYVDANPDGEAVATEEKDGKPVIPKAQPGSVYRIKATWDNGTVEYGFRTK